jgi:hypothetical protein
MSALPNSASATSISVVRGITLVSNRGLRRGASKGSDSGGEGAVVEMGGCDERESPKEWTLSRHQAAWVNDAAPTTACPYGP